MSLARPPASDHCNEVKFEGQAVWFDIAAGHIRYLQASEPSPANTHGQLVALLESGTDSCFIRLEFQIGHSPVSQEPQGYLSQLTPVARIICLRLVRGEANMTKGLVTESGVTCRDGRS